VSYVIVLFIGIATGAACMFLYVWQWHTKIKERELAAETLAHTAREAAEAARAKHLKLDQLTQDVHRLQADLDSRVISYQELLDENRMLKRDLQNIDVNLHKLMLDEEASSQRQDDLDARGTALARRYLTENVKAIVSSVGPNNFVSCKSRLAAVIDRVREIGFSIGSDEERSLHEELREEFEREVRREFERQEQVRIRAQIREEERRQREVDREVQQRERERLAVQAALDQALAEARGQFNEEVQRLQARLAEAEENSKRAMSMAQQTKEGHIYVISNIGAFGMGIFKVGMTRRLNPQERVIELGDASVPFPFDVHAMIHCKDAPTLENALHRALHKKRVNKANPRKEFFRTEIEEVIRIVKEHHGEVQFVADPEAMEYRQSLSMSEEDAEFIEEVYEEAGEDADSMADDQ
jgi:hypothetical protein